jgi:hypothetical protein
MLKRILCAFGFHQWKRMGEPYKWEGTVTYIGTVASLNNTVEVSETRQKRECADCGIIQEREI